MDRPHLFMHSSVSEYSGCFYLLEIMNNAVIDIETLIYKVCIIEIKYSLKNYDTKFFSVLNFQLKFSFILHRQPSEHFHTQMDFNEGILNANNIYYCNYYFC